MDSKAIKEAVESTLMNGVTDPRIGAYELAAWAHVKTSSTSMSPWVRGEGGSWEEICWVFDFSPVDQDSILVTIEHTDFEELLVMLFPKDDRAIVTLRMDGEEDVDSLCIMTIPKFFEYLNSIPNIYAFARPESVLINGGSEETREVGLYLLKSLSMPGPAYPGSE